MSTLNYVLEVTSGSVQFHDALGEIRNQKFEVNPKA